ncbi:MAG: PadR family transcriptional regulator [Clostridiaceae bacterium]|nr:PadR family transcriptional regulator [Oscillospiraceae bacterium]NLO62033.1 PadR family transcriptional regulator [Clostridiaceae bacterium]
MSMEKIIKAYIPMSETAYYILLSLNEPRHGYGIIKFVEELTKRRIILGSGTVYGTLGKMSKDRLISIYDDKDRKTVYRITDDGKALLLFEIDRLKKVYENTISQEGLFR